MKSLKRVLLQVGALCFVNGSKKSKELIFGFVQGNIWLYFVVVLSLAPNHRVTCANHTLLDS